MNIFNLEPKTDVDYFLPGTFVKRKSSGGLYLVISVDKENQTLKLQAWGKRRPLTNEPITLSASEMTSSKKHNEDKELKKVANNHIFRENFLEYVNTAPHYLTQKAKQ